MSELNVSRLERHARLLMRAYPPAYRADRGEEMIGTLLEATPPGRSWPLAYEAASVISGGLRARRAANLRQGPLTSLRQAAILCVALYLAQFPGELVWSLVRWAQGGYKYFPSYEVQAFVLPSALVAVIMAAAWSGRRSLVVVPTVVTFAATLVYFVVTRSAAAGTLSVYLVLIGLVALAVLAPLVTRAARPPMSFLWLMCLQLAVAGLYPLVMAAFHDGFFALQWPIDHLTVSIALSNLSIIGPYSSYLSLIPVIVAVCWLVTDVRPLIGVILASVLPNTVVAVTHIARGGVRFFTGSAVLGPTVSQPVWPTLVAVAVPLVLACALVWLLRHRTRTSPPNPS
ncbi:MAG TPA: hypothetical protein VN714_04175 [Trebonia sp.]|nr:hypothetical protein [Trebonia sp.]